MRALWTIVFIVTIAGVVANTSRMAQVVALVLLVVIGVHFGPGLLRRLPGAQKSVAIAGALALILALIALAQATHLEQPLNRWQSVGEQIPADARWQASRVALGALPSVGFFGFGPGTFRVVFPGYNIGSGHAVPGSWRFLHEDYLQTMLEWGWLGSSLWALLFFGGIAVGILSYHRYAIARLDAEKTRDAAFGYHSPRREWRCMRWSIFHFKSSRFSCMSRRIWVCAGEAACGTTSQRSDVTVQRPWSGLSTAESRLRSLRDRSRTSTVAPRIRSFFLTVTMRSVIVIVTNPAAPPQTIQDQTSRTDT